MKTLVDKLTSYDNLKTILTIEVSQQQQSSFGNSNDDKHLTQLIITARKKDVKSVFGVC